MDKGEGLSRSVKTGRPDAFAPDSDDLVSVRTGGYAADLSVRRGFSANAVGTGVRCLGGMVTATVLAIFFVPVFFVVVRHRRFSRKANGEHSHSTEHR